MSRPLFFLAAQSRSSITEPISPVGPTTMSQVSFAISPARRPAFIDKSTIRLLRKGYLVEEAKTRRLLICRSESILACLPDISECSSTCEMQTTILIISVQVRRAIKQLVQFLLVQIPFLFHGAYPQSIREMQGSRWSRCWMRRPSWPSDFAGRYCFCGAPTPAPGTSRARVRRGDGVGRRFTEPQ